MIPHLNDFDSSTGINTSIATESITDTMENSSSYWSAYEATSAVNNHYEIAPAPANDQFSPFLIGVFSLGLLLVVIDSKTRFQTKLSSPAVHKFEKPVWYPHKDPILGLDILFQLARAVYNHTFLEFTTKLISRFNGTISYLSLGRQAVYTIDPENVHTMLVNRKGFQDFGLGITRTRNFRSLFGSGISNSDGAVWKNHRTTLRPLLARITESEVDIFEIHLQRLIRHVPADGSTIDLQRVLNAMTLDISTELFLGKSTSIIPLLFDSENHGIIKGQEFSDAFDHALRAMSGIDDFSLSGLCWKLLFGDKKVNESLRTVHSFIDEVIEQATESCPKQAEQSKLPENKGQAEPLFYKLIKENKPKEDIKYNLINLLAAGKDSMTSFLTSVWFVLSQRPDVCDKIRAEISGLQGQRPTLDELSKFSYLRMVLQEVLRVYPPVPINQRTAEVDTVLPRGGGADGKSPLSVPRGASVGYSIYAMHRLPEYFGEDVDEFRPERWLEIKPKGAFIPFHAGPRVCIGQQLALTLAKYSTIRLLQHYDGVDNRNTEPWQEKLGLNCTSRHGVKVGLTASN